jgi:hypothetical protein
MDGGRSHGLPEQVRFVSAGDDHLDRDPRTTGLDHEIPQLSSKLFCHLGFELSQVVLVLLPGGT